jgi:hypothetical protein
MNSENKDGILRVGLTRDEIQLIMKLIPLAPMQGNMATLMDVFKKISVIHEKLDRALQGEMNDKQD